MPISPREAQASACAHIAKTIADINCTEAPAPFFYNYSTDLNEGVAIITNSDGGGGAGSHQRFERRQTHSEGQGGMQKRGSRAKDSSGFQASSRSFLSLPIISQETSLLVTPAAFSGTRSGGGRSGANKSGGGGREGGGGVDRTGGGDENGEGILASIESLLVTPVPFLRTRSSGSRSGAKTCGGGEGEEGGGGERRVGRKGNYVGILASFERFESMVGMVASLPDSRHGSLIARYTDMFFTMYLCVSRMRVMRYTCVQ